MEQKDKAIKIIVEKKREMEDRFKICNKQRQAAPEEEKERIKK